MDAPRRGLYAASMRGLLGVVALAGCVFSIGACGGSSEVNPTGGNGTTTSAGGGATTSAAGGEGGATATTSATGGGGEGGAPPMMCEGKTGPLGNSILTLTSGGALRAADVHVPEQYDPSLPTSLVFNFHGFGSNSLQQALLSLMDSAADERNFIVVYPNGTVNSWNAGICCGTAATLAVDDVAYVSDLIDELSKQYCIDPKRVFATGMSNGAFLAHRLACELSDKIAAIAPVAGVIGIPMGDCQPPRKVPVLHFHGTADLLVPYEGGGVSFFPSVEDSIARWREIDKCGAQLEITFDEGDTQCVAPVDCADGAEVILCTVENGGHTWPGGTPVPSLGITTTDIDATARMLDFFEKHPMP